MLKAGRMNPYFSPEHAYKGEAEPAVLIQGT